MSSMAIFLQWGWLLLIALFAPASLPVGGAQLSVPELRRREYSDPLLVTKKCYLHCRPADIAPSLNSLPIGTPMKILRVWHCSQGKEWIHVQVTSIENKQFNNSYSARHGWINV